MAFSAESANYAVTPSGSVHYVALTSTPATRQLVTHVRLRFPDRNLALDVDANPGKIYRLYQAALNRVPDQSGVGYYLNAVESQCVSLNQVAANFMASPEFVSAYGALNTAQFVTRLYLNVLKRQPDAAGLSHHTSNLNTSVLTRAEVLLQFSESPENQAAVAPAIANGITYYPVAPPNLMPMISPFGLRK